MEICRGINATTQVTEIANGLNASQILYLFIKVEPNDTPNCSWKGYNQTDNCDFLTEAITAIHNIHILGQVFSTATIWESFFGNTCNSIASIAPYLWYAHYNSSGQVDPTQSFDDYVVFGGWEVNVSVATPFMKQVGGNATLTLCNNSDWHARVDTVWTPY